MKSVKKLFLSASAVALLGGGITAASAGEAWSNS